MVKDHEQAKCGHESGSLFRRVHPLSAGGTTLVVGHSGRLPSRHPSLYLFYENQRHEFSRHSPIPVRHRPSLVSPAGRPFADLCGAHLLCHSILSSLSPLRGPERSRCHRIPPGPPAVEETARSAAPDSGRAAAGGSGLLHARRHPGSSHAGADVRLWPAGLGAAVPEDLQPAAGAQLHPRAGQGASGAGGSCGTGGGQMGAPLFGRGPARPGQGGLGAAGGSRGQRRWRDR